MDAGRYAEAMALMADLAAKWPDEYRFVLQLAFC